MMELKNCKFMSQLAPCVTNPNLHISVDFSGSRIRSFMLVPSHQVSGSENKDACISEKVNYSFYLFTF